jgi:hypothetical protein
MPLEPAVPLAPPVDDAPPVPVQTIVMQPLPMGVQRLQLALQQYSPALHTAVPQVTVPEPPVDGEPPVAARPPVDGAPPADVAPPDPGEGHVGTRLPHCPVASQDLTFAVSVQFGSLGAQSVH